MATRASNPRWAVAFPHHVRLCLALGGLALVLSAGSAGAATITVTSAGDTIAVDGFVTLREAITSINQGANVNADVVASGSYGSSDTIAFRITGSPPGGVHSIRVASPLPALTRTVRIDGETQTLAVGDTNPGTSGAGGPVGAAGLVLAPVDRPEIEITPSGAVATGLAIAAGNVVIRHLAIYGFTTANIDVRQNSNAVLIEHNVIGSAAASFTDPGAGRRPATANVLVGSGTNNGIIRHNLIGFGGGDGLDLSAGGATYQIVDNEIRDNGLTSVADGVDLAGQNTPNPTVRHNLIAGNAGFGIDLFVSNGNATVEENTITGNGGAGVGIGLNNNRITRNVISLNGGSGILVGASANGNPFSRNSIFGNGLIGIDLLRSSDNQAMGTSPFSTPNDSNDSDNGGNGLLNFPVITEATISSGSLQVSGFARPGSVIEFFIADPDPTGFGEGETYLITLAEQSSDDLDSTTGSYGPGPVNGLNQGSDTTNRFRFVVPTPTGLMPGMSLTATATSANSTSEFGGNVLVGGGTPTPTLTLGGTVFEDVQYGGGPGRSLAESAGVGRPGAVVELYDSTGAFLSATITDGSGAYTFAGLPVDATYFVRVVNASVTSSRPGGTVPGLFPVQTFRTDVSTRRTLPHGQVGGAVPEAQDSPAKSAGASLGDADVEQSVTQVVAHTGVTSISGLDFGFNFDTIVNVNDAGQGSLRQFLVHANTLQNAGLDQADTLAPIPPGVEASLFMIPAPGLQTIGPLSALPPLTDAATWIDATLQPGTGATPSIELTGASAPGANGLVLSGGNGSLVRGVVVNRFAGSGILISGGSGHRVERNRIGTDAGGTASLPNGVGVTVEGGASAITIGAADPASGNVIAFNGRGVVVGPTIADVSAGVSILGNSIFANTGLGIDLGGDGVTPNDSGDADAGPNDLVNFPVLTRSVIQSSSVTLEGFARPGSVIEVFVADVDPTGFGEGRSHSVTVTEGASNDLDSGTGSYGPTVNGLPVGSDTTNRFRFVLPIARLRQAVPLGATLTATATLNGSTSEFSGAITPEYPADLSVTIQAPAMVQPGAALVYTVTVTNLGPGHAAGVAVNVTAPSALVFESNAGACTTPLPCVFAALPSGASQTFTSTFTVPADFRSPLPIVGRAAVSSTTVDPIPGNDTASTTTVLPLADLAIIKTEASPRTGGTDPLVFQIRVRNLGPHEALDVTVSDPTPAGITFVGNAGACTTPFPCNLGPLAPGAEQTIVATYAVPFALTAPVANTATVTSTTPDANLANNSATASAPRRSNLSVTKTGPASVSPGQAVTYTIVVTNNGPGGVAAVTVEDPTPAGLIFVSTTGACETAFPCTIGALASGQQATILATYQVPDPFTTVVSVANTVTVSSPTEDPDTADNTATFASDFVASPGDGDGDGMPDVDETCYGLDPTRNDAAEDPDGDGRTNAQELADRTHPRGFYRQHLPEGADNSFFKTRLSLVNPDAAVTARVMVRLQPEGPPEVGACFPIPPRDSTVLDSSAPTALRAGSSGLGISFASLAESDLPLTIERTMTWVGGGEHVDTISDAPSGIWYFAEGATHGGFRVYYMLENPGLDPATVDILFLRGASATPVVKRYALVPRSRLTIFANELPELQNTDLSAIVRLVSGGPITASRSVYRDTAGVLLRAGASSSGSSTAATDWYFGEGATSDFFAEYLLVLNPDPAASELELTFLRDGGGAPVTAQVTAPPASRLTLPIADLGVLPTGSSTSLHVRSTNGVPVVVERSMWWPNQPGSPEFWTEGHLSTGSRATAPAWEFASQTLDANTNMYLLVGNFSEAAGQILVTFTFEDGVSSSRTIDVAARSRTTLIVNELAPGAVGRSLYIEVASLGSPLSLAVERAVYRTQNGVFWSSGSVTFGTPRP